MGHHVTVSGEVLDDELVSSRLVIVVMKLAPAVPDLDDVDFLFFLEERHGRWSE